MDEPTSAPTYPAGTPNAVYVMTNEAAPAGNAVVVFDRAPDGALTQAGTFPTGGLGTGPSPVNPGGTDPLTSQAPLILSRDNRWLLAVNAGSNEISVLAVTRTGLRLVEKVGSKGNRPVSLAINRNLLYVLNAEGTISGFNLSRVGGLTALGASTRSLIGGPRSDPAQVSFDPSGDLLVVTEKGTQVIDVFPVADDGRPGDPVRNESSGQVPFGFTFSGADLLIVSELGVTDSSASSYRVLTGGTLQVISGSVSNGQGASCWAVVSGSYAYISNTLSGTITGYRIGDDGSLSLLDPNGVTAVTGDNSFPIEMAVTPDGKFLYVIKGGTGTIGGFRVEPDGSLTPLSDAGSFSPSVEGIAVH